MSGYFVDLHTHSTASDGTDSPAALVRKAVDDGLAALAITDHDTIDGLDEAEEEAGKHGLKFIRGCELAVYTPGFRELHILGLWMPRNVPELDEMFAETIHHRKARNKKMLAKLRECGVDITDDDVRELSKGSSPGRPHIAKALVAKGYVSNYDEAFQRYIDDEACAFVPRALLSPVEGISVLARNGATPILAHPFLRDKLTVERLEAILPGLIDAGLAGIEAYHSAHDDIKVRNSLVFAEKYDLLVSGGSDYHGRAKPDVRLGTCHGGMRVSARLLEIMEKRRLSQGLWI